MSGAEPDSDPGRLTSAPAGLRLALVGEPVGTSAAVQAVVETHHQQVRWAQTPAGLAEHIAATAMFVIGNALQREAPQVQPDIQAALNRYLADLTDWAGRRDAPYDGMGRPAALTPLSWPVPHERSQKLLQDRQEVLAAALLEDVSGRDALVEALQAARPYVADVAMCQVLEAATNTMPDAPLHHDDAPAPAGLLMFAWPFAAFLAPRQDDVREHRTADQQSFLPGDPVSIDAVLWRRGNFDGRPGVSLWAAKRQPARFATAPMTRMVTRRMVWLDGETFEEARQRCLQAQEAEWGEGTGRDELGGSALSNTVTAILRAAVALWHLSRQPITTTRHQHPDRRVRRKAALAQVYPATGVAVTYLRHTQRPAGKPIEAPVLAAEIPTTVDGTTEETSRPNRTHRWVVTGHWRNQWYPRSNVHRPIYIYGYVKGPDGKPLNDPTRVWLATGKDLLKGHGPDGKPTETQ